MIYLLRLVISSRASLRAIFKSVFSGWFLKYSAVDQILTIFAQIQEWSPTKHSKSELKTSETIKKQQNIQDWPTLPIRSNSKSFLFLVSFGIFEKSNFSWFSKMSNFGSKILPEGAFACIKILSFIKKNFFLASDWERVTHEAWLIYWVIGNDVIVRRRPHLRT